MQTSKKPICGLKKLIKVSKGGTIEGAVNHKGVKVFSEVVITKEKFTTVDKGDDGVTWGNTPGPFVFKRKYID